MLNFAILNADNQRLLRNTDGQVATWATEDAAWDWAMTRVANFDIVPV